MVEGLRILMLEDSPTGAYVVKREVQRAVPEPFSLRHELDRDGFTRALREFRPHLVLTDGRVPNLDAAGALSLVRQTLPGAAVIVVAGELGDRGAPLVERGAFGCVLKHRIGELGPMLRRALAGLGEAIQEQAPAMA